MIQRIFRPSANERERQQGGDQFFPNIAFVNAGERLIVSYYSRSHDPLNFMIHRRARLATLGAPASGFQAQFSDRAGHISARPYELPLPFNYLGEYTGIAGGDGAVSTVWPMDGPLGERQSQYDIYFARIAVAPPIRQAGAQRRCESGERHVLGEQTTSSDR